MARLKNYLEYSKNEDKTKQKLLFAETAFVYPSLKGKHKVPEKFYSDGYSIINNVDSPKSAKEILEAFTANLNKVKLLLLSNLNLISLYFFN